MDGGDRPSLAPSTSHGTASASSLALSSASSLALSSVLSSASSSALTSSSFISSIPSTSSSPSLISDVLLNFHASPSQPNELQLFIYGFVLVLIPTATILGNVLVIISVLRFKSLHSAINFLILGLAIADLMVALFVMPYAVYVYVQGGRWLLGPLMCNLYLSSDVACSTASIILLALISFDRYQAISHPIQYSRQAQNIARVVRLFFGVWVYSLLVASPIVLGFNDPPPAESTSAALEPFECRFYNPWFSLLSSLVSFLLPCCVVILVYLRIIRALRRRERAAKARKQTAANSAAHHQQQATAIASEKVQLTSGNQMESEEAGEIVAGPAINMMMIALPSLNRQMRRYERHRRALEEAALAEDELSSSESLSDDIRILTNDFFSEVLTSNSKASASLEPPHGSFASGTPFSGFRASFSGAMDFRKKSMAEEIVPTIFVPRKRSACDFGTFNASREPLRKNTAPIKIRMASVRETSRDRTETEVVHRSQLLLSPFTGNFELRKNSEVPKMKSNGTAQQRPQHQRHRQQMPHKTATRGALSFPLVKRIALGRDIRVNHYLLNDGEDTTDLIVAERTSTMAQLGNGGTRVLLGEPELPKQQRLNDIEGQKMRNGAVFGSASFRGPSMALPLMPPFRRGTSSIELFHSAGDNDASEEPETTSTTRVTNDNMARATEQNHCAGNTTALSMDTPSNPPHQQQIPTLQKLPTTATVSIGTDYKSPRNGAGMASEQSSRRDRHASLRRKVHKSQRKEKRATKTLGIVVGTFLCCWVPFFSLNIANALCVEIGAEWCQIGFGPFFYSTWVGYMNSFMNPVIYTIFNAEFRRAFKSLLLGRRGNVFARRI